MRHNFQERNIKTDDITPEGTLNLYDQGGNFVANVPVIPFTIPPQVIVWGERVFNRAMYAFATANNAAEAAKYKIPAPLEYPVRINRIQYREVFAYVVPTALNLEDYGKAGG